MIEEKENFSEICKGCIDTHIHSSPDITPRKLDDFEVAYQAKKAKMAAILIKNHHEPTTSRACLVQKIIGKEIKVFGGCVLNYSVGGLNPEIVEIQIKLGAKEIWMPTVDAKNHILKMRQVKNSSLANFQRKGISILDEKSQKLLPQVYSILELIANNDIILGTGHLSIKEIIVLVQEAKKLGVRKLLITHPEWGIVNMPIDVQNDLAKEGVYFERCLYFLTDRIYKKGIFSVTLDAIKKVGVESTILATDYGQKYNSTPVSGLIDYVTRLKKAGYTQKDLDIMTIKNPSFFLGLNK